MEASEEDDFVKAFMEASVEGLVEASLEASVEALPWKLSGKYP